ncbi:MAG: RnfABCDGE type electron transport complex subunit B [Planctomycetes bacterium]|nr:RnfABCDGE type electron transport complex subunit B [Planctomycetota bacterium]
MLFFTAVAAICGLTAVLATLLAMADRRLRVQEDPRIDTVEEMLPHANCGACGYPGCRPFAEALVEGKAKPGKCSVSTDAGRERIAGYLGVDVGAEEKRVARLACAGGANVARAHAHYQGMESCAAAALVAGGGKGCFYGCLGLADCEVACTFDAIRMNEHHLPVVDEDRCTACGDCVVACPKDLFSLHAVSHRLWVACNSAAAGDEILADCQVACTACGRCAADAPGLITMRNNLPVIDYTREHATKTPIQRCPTGAIVWLDAKAGPVKGPAAPKILRKGARQDAPT